MSNKLDKVSSILANEYKQSGKGRVILIPGDPGYDRAYQPWKIIERSEIEIRKCVESIVARGDMTNWEVGGFLREMSTEYRRKTEYTDKKYASTKSPSSKKEMSKG